MSTNITSVKAKVTVFGVATEYTGFVLGADGYWTKQITAPDRSSFLNNTGNYFDVEITATDEATNTATVNVSDFSSLKLFVKEKVAPVITISGVTNGSTINNSKPEICINIKDTNSGVPTTGCYISIDGSSAATNAATAFSVPLTAISDTEAEGYFTPSDSLSEGSHTIKVYAKDNDDNSGTAEVTFNVITSNPDLTIIEPSADRTVTNNPIIHISLRTNTNTGNKIEIFDNGKLVISTSNGPDEIWSGDITISEPGEHVITVKVTNSMNLSSTDTRTVIIDVDEPIFEEVVITPNPVIIGQNQTYTIKVKVR